MANLSAKHGAVAAGDTATANAAADILKAGGNAYDAVLAAMFASTVAEPILSSLGGGGFLLAQPDQGAGVLYDFFAQTPRQKRTEVDFYPVLADFGTVTQEFHIGMGSIATPGMVKGAFEVHRDWGSLPMTEIVQPAIDLARNGVTMSALQAYIFKVVEPIYKATPECRAQFSSTQRPDHLVQAGETIKHPQQADFLDILAREGEELFYQGEVAAQVARDCEDKGGHLDRGDFEAYRVEKRTPLRIDFEGARILTNPPPSVGGILIGFALRLLAGTGIGQMGCASAQYLTRLAHIMDLTNQARVESGLNLHPNSGADMVLDEAFVERYRKEVQNHPASHRGTTHISVIDRDGNAAAMTVSNGEGSAYVAPHTGVVFNNMLGEEDINPKGFHQWPMDTRMSSMMAPSLIQRADGAVLALGSGGSNRIRTALLQSILNVLAFDMALEDAVCASRVHFERGVLNVEGGIDGGVREQLRDAFENCQIWDQQNMFFGGVHAVEYRPASQELLGCGDPRRGGIAMVV